MRIISGIRGSCQEGIFEAPSACLSSLSSIGPGASPPGPPGPPPHASPPSCAVVPGPGGLPSRPGPFGPSTSRGPLSRADGRAASSGSGGRSSGGPAVFPSPPQALPGPLPCGPPSASGPGLGAVSLSFLGLSSQDYLDCIAQTSTAPGKRGPENDKPRPRKARGKATHKQKFVLGTTESGEQFAKFIPCTDDACEGCRPFLEARRFSRWLEKAKKIDSMLYAVVSPRPSDCPRTKKGLNDWTKKIEGIYKRRGDTRGLSGFHAFGDDRAPWPTPYHPHWNLLMEGGWVPEEDCEEIKKALCAVLGLDEIVVHYGYFQDVISKVHKIKYVTRATFLKAEWDPFMHEELRGFRAFRSWGEWGDPGCYYYPEGPDNAPLTKEAESLLFARWARTEERRERLRAVDYYGDKWALPEVERGLADHHKIEAGFSPDSGERIIWRGVISLDRLKEEGWTEVWDGIWQFRPPPARVLLYLLFKREWPDEVAGGIL